MRIVLVGRQAVAAVVGVVSLFLVAALAVSGFEVNTFADQLPVYGLILDIPFCVGVIVGSVGLHRAN